MCMGHRKCLLASSCVAIHLAFWPRVTSMAPIGWIFVKFDTEDFYENLSRNSKFGYSWAEILGTLHKDLGSFKFLTAVQKIL
jgi:hypothetical protein